MNDIAHSPIQAPAASSSTATGQRFDGIQILRFCAAFAVVVSHAFIFTAQKFPIDPGLVELAGWGGGWSVTLFFCISGFVITHSAQGLSAGQFLAHRLARIYPAYWLAVACVCAGKFVLFGSLPLSELSWPSMTLLPFGERSYPLWIEWSLIYEVFFYLVFALIWAARSNRFVLIAASAWLVSILVAARIAPDWASARYPNLSQIFLSTRNLPFILGVYCYYWRGHFTPALRTVMITLFPAGVAGIAILPGTDLKVIASAIAAFGLLGYVVSSATLLSRDSATVKLGDFSYGIYLVHVSVITVALAVGFKQYQNPWLAMLAVTAVGTAAGAVFGYAELAMYKRIKRWIDARAGTWPRLVRYA